MRSDQLRAF